MIGFIIVIFGFSFSDLIAELQTLNSNRRPRGRIVAEIFTSHDIVFDFAGV